MWSIQLTVSDQGEFVPTGHIDVTAMVWLNGAVVFQRSRLCTSYDWLSAICDLATDARGFIIRASGGATV